MNVPQVLRIYAPEIVGEWEAYQRAKSDLEKAFRRAFPIGTTLQADIGRARVCGEIVLHSDDLEFGSVTVLNSKTGKRRRVSLFSDYSEVSHVRRIGCGT